VTATTERVPRGRVLALGGLSAFGPLALDLYLPGLPQLTSDLRTSEAAGQLSLSMCMIGLALGQLLVGPYTDRVGRRGPLLAGVGVFVISAALCAISPSIELLLLLRLLTGLAGGAGVVIARAMVRDL
jgi:DHA1 family bicyclomycin/chloramphenicol resistance-like MFS transporter